MQASQLATRLGMLWAMNFPRPPFRVNPGCSDPAATLQAVTTRRSRRPSNRSQVAGSRLPGFRIYPSQSPRGLLPFAGIPCVAIHGRVGDRVYKTYGDTFVVTRVPRFEGYVPSAAQRERRDKLRAAIAFAKACTDPINHRFHGSAQIQSGLAPIARMRPATVRPVGSAAGRGWQIHPGRSQRIGAGIQEGSHDCSAPEEGRTLQLDSRDLVRERRPQNPRLKRPIRRRPNALSPIGLTRCSPFRANCSPKWSADSKAHCQMFL